MKALFALVNLDSYKLKNSSIYPLSVFTPLLIVLFIFIYFLYKGINTEDLVGVNAWENYFYTIIQVFIFLIPLYLNVSVFACLNIEFGKNISFYNMKILPASISNMYFSKQLTIIITLIFSVLFSGSLIIISGFIFSYLLPNTRFNDFSLLPEIVKFYFYLVVNALALIQLFFFISFLFKKLITTLLIGNLLVIVGLMFYKVEAFKYNPFSHLIMFFSSFNQKNGDINFELISINMIFFFCFFVLNYFQFKRV